MHIVHIGKYYSPAIGGMESLVRSHATTQARMGHKVDVVAINHLSKHGTNLISRSFGVSDRETTQDDLVQVHKADRFASLFKYDFSRSFSAIIKTISATRPDVWHLHTPNATAVVALQRLLPLCSPLIVTHHSDVLNQKLFRKLYETLEARVYRESRAVLSDTAGYVTGSRQLRKFENKLSIVPIGVDIEAFSNSTPDIEMLSKQYHHQFIGPIWLCVGRMVPYKGFHIAIKALNHVSGTLILVGDGPLSTDLKKLAKNLDLTSRVHFHGQCTPEQLRALYRAATALWFPSTKRNEGFGIAQVEAMASGCPVINTEIAGSGVHEVSLHGKTGFTIPCGSPRALADASQRLLDDQDLRKEFCQNAKSRALYFDNFRVNEKLIELYRSIVLEP
jgi:glycosyltransferase involved in cell wall biosynthesis